MTTPFRCPHCGVVSHNPHDAEERYCARCHLFVDDLPGRSLTIHFRPCRRCGALIGCLGNDLTPICQDCDDPVLRGQEG
jgi:hypothetical protein